MFEDSNIDSFIENENLKSIYFKIENIDNVRNLKKITGLKFSQKTAIVLKNIDNATEEAQNALLKSIEEPQENLYFILVVKNISSILPTIISRCQIIGCLTLKRAVPPITDTGIINFSTSDLDKMFETISNCTKRDEAINFVTNLITHNYENRKFQYLQYLLETLESLKLNGNVSLQLSNLLVKMNSH